MTEELEMLSRMASDLLARARADADSPEQLWHRFNVAGLVGIGVPEAAGGSGGDLAAAAVVVRRCAQNPDAVGLPVGETLLVAHWLREQVGLPAHLGPTAVSRCGDMQVQRGPDGLRLTGTSERLGGACAATSYLLVARDSAGDNCIVSIGPADARTGVSVAPDLVRSGLGLGTVICQDVPLASNQLKVLPASVEHKLELRSKLLTTLHLAGLLEEAKRITVRYARIREQFGRPIGDFQMVKDKLALIAGEVAVVDAITDAALEAITFDDGTLPVLAAALRARRAATTVARLAHQVHGTIGVTAEYDLHRFTTQLWHWSGIDGVIADAERTIAELVLADGADGFWPAVVK